MSIDIFIRRCLSRLTSRLAPPRTYLGELGPYLSRWVLARWGDAGPQLCLHFFHRSDADQDLHTHPWAWAVALQLAGGYREERFEGGADLPGIVTRERRPGALVFIDQATAHRVDLLDARGSWSLILLGPRISSWGFVDRNTLAFTPWREALRRRGLTPIEVA